MKRLLSGMSLVELLLALLLGTLVVATAIGVFVGNRQTMAVSQGLGQIQQTMQVALALMARDLRQAGGNPCHHSIPLANVLHAPASRWWTRLASTPLADGQWSLPWQGSLRGLTAAEFATGTGAGARVAGSDAIELLLADGQAATVVSHDGTRLVVNTTAHGFSSGNLLLVCDPRQASLFQAQVSGAQILHPASGLNCSPHLGLGGCAAEPFLYAPHALIARWAPVRWYLGDHGRGGTALYRMVLEGNGQGVTRQEMIENVTALEFRYLLAGALEPVTLAGVAGRWNEVIGVRITLEARAHAAHDGAGTALTRRVVQTVNLRNRSP